MEIVEASGAWPPKLRVFDVGVSPVDYDRAESAVIAAARQRRGGIVDHMSVHGLMLARRDPEFRRILCDFDLVAADGQPVRWALNRFHGTALEDRVYGPELMLRLCRRAATEKMGIYLLGGSEAVLSALCRRLPEVAPGLVISGAESPPFRELTSIEETETIDRINRSGASLAFIGLGCPKQEAFASRNRHRVRAVQLCVGAAFDFHAGAKPTAPAWLQRAGLEWAFRLATEPRRLFSRYLVNNTLFLLSYARGNRPS